jgi:DNA-binding NtrC family response regulator
MKLLQSLQEFDLLVTDLRMTPIDGMELIALAKRERPGMRILIVSAYLDAATEARAREAGCHRFVRKPFALNDLLDPIRDALLGKDDLTAELPSPEPRAIEDVSAQESSPVEEPPERRSPPPPPNDEWII